jgi:hypothetical protein
MYINIKQNESSERTSSLKIEKDKSFTVLGNLPHGYNFVFPLPEAKKMVKYLQEIIAYEEDKENFFDLITLKLDEYFVDAVLFFVFNDKENVYNVFSNTQKMQYRFIKGDFIKQSEEFCKKHKKQIKAIYRNKDFQSLLHMNNNFCNEILNQYK